MSDVTARLQRTPAFQTFRKDTWWLEPTLTFLGLSAFILYGLWRAFEGAHYSYGNYISPFFSPVFWGDEHHAIFGSGRPPFWPSWLIYSPSFLVAWAPLGFRFTCYYYRGAYYKAFWADPPSCAVGEPRSDYLGEHKPPLIFQNAHRYFMYLAVAFMFILTYDLWLSLWFEDGFGIGVGTLISAANVGLLSMYTFGCHSVRHLVGGRIDIQSKHELRKKCYDACSTLNRRHQLYAWGSITTVIALDLYISLCSRGIISDWRLL